MSTKPHPNNALQRGLIQGLVPLDVLVSGQLRASKHTSGSQQEGWRARNKRQGAPADRREAASGTTGASCSTNTRGLASPQATIHKQVTQATGQQNGHKAHLISPMEMRLSGSTISMRCIRSRAPCDT